MSIPFEEQQLQEQVAADRTQLHSESADTWQRHADGPPRDRAADAEVRAAIQAEQHGEWDEDGTYRPSSWRSV